MMSEKSLLDFVVFRSMYRADYNFVLSSWAHSFKGSPWAGVVPNNDWHASMKNIIDQLQTRGSEVVMAVADDDRDQIMGYVCYEKSLAGIPVIHYIFVKDDFRREGLGTALLGVTGNGSLIYTFRTEDSQYLNKMGTHVPAIARRKDLEPVYASIPAKKRNLP
jgi:GNAT superfamily N-acetyltransferase